MVVLDKAIWAACYLDEVIGTPRFDEKATIILENPRLDKKYIGNGQLPSFELHNFPRSEGFPFLFHGHCSGDNPNWSCP